MAYLNFLAHSATDILDIVAHSLNTGDGPALAFPPGGASGGLDSAADYWIIKVDADHVKLATSQANALAGSPVVDITTTMSGVLALGLPYRRATTYVAGISQVKSLDLNAFQDAEVGKRHGLVRRSSAPCIVNNAVGISWSLNASDLIQSSGTGVALLKLDAEVGDLIVGLEILALGDGAADAQMDLFYVDAAMAQHNIGSLADNNRAAAWGFAIVPVSPHQLVDGERLRLSVNASAANYQIGQLKLIYARPG